MVNLLSLRLTQYFHFLTKHLSVCDLAGYPYLGKKFARMKTNDL
jgi:hypothetical protein